MLAQEAHDGRISDFLMAIGCTVGPIVVGAGVWLVVWGRRHSRRVATAGDGEQTARPPVT
jgi:hypothetical protein